MQLTPGTVLQNRYVVEGSVTSGGMGEVYRAHDRRLNVAVAVKRMVPPPGIDAITCASLNVQFTKEAQTLARLRHRNVVGVSDCFDQGGDLYLVMEYVEGRSLAEVVEARGKLPEGRVLTWAAQLLDALAHCHVNGVIHRDIKPSNVLIDGEGQAVLIDFGIAKQQETGAARTRTAIRDMGTPEYCPIEQYDVQVGNDARSDLYSLAATLYHALGGEPPALATSRVLSPAALKPLRALCPALSERTAQAIQRALALRPEDRFQSAREMAAALPPPPEPPEPAPPPPAPRISTRRLPEEERSTAPKAPPARGAPPQTEVFTPAPPHSAPVAPAASPLPTPPTLRPHTAASPAAKPAGPPASSQAPSSQIKRSLAGPPLGLPASSQASSSQAPSSPAKRKLRPWVRIAAVLAVLAVLALGVVWGLYRTKRNEQERQYAAALADLEAGRCAEARETFLALGDYKGSAERAAECFLVRAEQALEAQQWDFARLMVHEVADHPAAQHIRAESYYRPAMNAIERGTWERAADQIVALNGFAPYYQNLGALAADLPELRETLWKRYSALWREHDAVLLATFSDHTDIVQSVLLSPDGKHLLSGSSDGTVRAWSTTRLSGETVFHQHDGIVFSMALSPDGSRLATGSSDGLIRLWEAPDWQMIGVFEGHEGWVSDLAFSPNGRELASVATDQTVRLWNVSPPLPELSEKRLARTLGLDYVQGDRLLVLAEGQRGTWIGWSPRFVSPENPVDMLSTCVAVQSYGELVAVGAPTGAVHLWQVREAGLRHAAVYEGLPGKALSLTFGADGALLAAGSSSGTVRVWHVLNGDRARFWETGQGPLRALAFSPTGALLVTASDDQTIKLWTVRP